MNIEKLAREAGADWDHTTKDDRAFLERLAALVLEEAAKVSDQIKTNALIRWKQTANPFDEGAEAAAAACSEAIRALKDKT